jgi:hypothetical protein
MGHKEAAMVNTKLMRGIAAGVLLGVVLIGSSTEAWAYERGRHSRSYHSGWWGFSLVIGKPHVGAVVKVLPRCARVSAQTTTVYIPRKNGSVTAVTLVRHNQGYLGPQGEYYPGNPTVEQLKILYGD